MSEEKNFVSPYRLAIMTNVRPQMIYNYIRQNLIRATKNELNKWQVDLNESSVIKFIERRSK